MSSLPVLREHHEDLFATYSAVRRTTESLCAPLQIDDYQLQAAPEASPPKWHLAHVTWFFETFLLVPYLRGYAPFDARFGHLFNSYYVSVGSVHPRSERHALSRPTVEEVYRYRSHVDAHMGELLAAARGNMAAELHARLTLGLNHEQQHQELLVMDIKRNFFANPLLPAYRAGTPQPPVREAVLMRWIERPSGVREIGHAGSGFAFDNERPRHRAFVGEHRLGSRLVTNGEYLEFVESGGYARPDLWLSDGWTAIQSRGWTAPLYWRREASGWHEFTLDGLRPLEHQAPVCHVSHYEADAYARWRGARLPFEAELEIAGIEAPVKGNFLESGALHPRPAERGEGQWHGDAWEWTGSAYLPYPGFRPLAGALGEYNGKFMANQMVLRGGCCATPRSHLRPTYRNFFYPHDRWAFTGIRLAADA
jgi:ergothioneine biosynthesis protein EgtB